MINHPFDEDTATTKIADDTYRATVTDRWNTANKTPNGGYLTSIMLGALAAEMPFPDPLTCTATFLKPAVAGDALIEIGALRTGRTLATAQATMKQADKPVVHLVAGFVDRAAADGRTESFAEPPALPPVEQCFDPARSGVLDGLPIAQRTEYRLSAPPGWAVGKPSGVPSGEFWMRMAGGRRADAPALAFLVDGYAPAVLELGVMTPATVQLTVYLHAVPAPGWLACRHSTRFIRDGYHDENFEIWDADGVLVAESHQLATLL
ncbi:MAG: thioesterase family protein [Nocardioidaceae bacterium]